jgi:hypothetical protein
LKPTSKRFGCATLLAFDLVLFAPLLFTGGVFSSHDFVRAHYPWRGTADGVLQAENRLLSDPAASGETTLVRYRGFPDALFWNPWVSSGAIGPFHLAQGFLSPFVVLPSLLLPESAIETGILFLKFNVAFVAMYAFLRGRRFSDLAASVGAAAWAFATGQTVWGLWMQSSVSVTYPLLLLAVDRAFEEAAPARAILFASLAALLCLSGGFPHWILYGAFATGLYFAVRAVSHRRPAGRALVRMAAGGAIAIAILLPSILATGRFLRASGYENLRRGMGSAHPLPLRHLRLYFLPDYYGSPRNDDYRGIGWIPGDNYIETAVGVGVAAGGLAFVGLAALGRRTEARFASFLAASIAIPLYAGGPLLSRIGGLPLLDISLFARAKILILLAVGILAACGAEALERLGERAGGARVFALRLLPFLVAVPLALAALDFYPECRPARAVFRDTPGIARLREEIRDGGRFAAAGWTLIPNVSEALRLDDVRGLFLLDASYRRLLAAADPRCFGRYGTYLVFDPETLDPNAPVLDLLGVGVLAAPPGASSPVGPEVEALDAAPFEDSASSGTAVARDRQSLPLERIYDGSDMTLFRRPSPFPRFFFVSRALPGGVEETSRADRATLSSAVFVPGADLPRLEPAAAGRGGEGSIRITTLRPERFALETETPRPTLLVSTQKRFPPYWRTFVDGREEPSFPADGPFLGLEVPAGRHTVEGRFVVPRAELAVSLIGFLALGAVFVRARNLPESARPS